MSNTLRAKRLPRFISRQYLPPRPRVDKRHEERGVLGLAHAAASPLESLRCSAGAVVLSWEGGVGDSMGVGRVKLGREEPAAGLRAPGKPCAWAWSSAARERGRGTGTRVGLGWRRRSERRVSSLVQASASLAMSGGMVFGSWMARRMALATISDCHCQFARWERRPMGSEFRLAIVRGLCGERGRICKRGVVTG